MIISADATVTASQVLEEEVKGDSNARKTVQPRDSLQQNCPLLH